MASASTVSSNMRDSTNEAREAARDIGKAASAASGDMQKDMQNLRDDFARLAQQVADIVANRGSAAWQRAKTGMDDAVADAQDKSREAVDAMREVSDQFVEAIDEFDQEPPLHDASHGARSRFPVWRNVAPVNLGRGLLPCSRP